MNGRLKRDAVRLPQRARARTWKWTPQGGAGSRTSGQQNIPHASRVLARTWAGAQSDAAGDHEHAASAHEARARGSLRPRSFPFVANFTAMCTRISESQEGEQREGGKARRGRTVWREETKGRRSCRPVRRAGWGPPPASGGEPPVPRGSLSAPYRTTLPRGPSSRDDGFLSLPPRWSICLSSRHKAAWPELAGNRHLVQLLVGPVHPATEIWTRPSSLSAFLPSLIPT